MSPVRWYIASLLGVFSNMLILFIGATIAQLIICNYLFQKGKIIPILSFIYLVVNEMYYFYSVRYLIEVNPNVVLYGFLLIIPYGSFLFVTLLIYFYYSRKINKNKELNRTRILDL